jgi:hypothetical protein
MGESGAQRAVTPPSSDLGGSTPSAPTTIPFERVAKAFAVLLCRALPVEGDPFSLVVVTFGTGGHGRHYTLDESVFRDIKLMRDFVYIASTRARGVLA